MRHYKMSSNFIDFLPFGLFHVSYFTLPVSCTILQTNKLVFVLESAHIVRLLADFDRTFFKLPLCLKIKHLIF